jgi:uncharacterized ParB-like nuclease family protein
MIGTPFGKLYGMKKAIHLPPPPEPKTVSISLKVQKSVNEALAKAAKSHGRTRSALAQAIIEAWLRESGFLKWALRNTLLKENGYLKVITTCELGLNKIDLCRDTRLRRLRPELVAELAESMLARGQLQPIIVCECEGRPFYYLIAGHHRCAAAKKLNWLKIRAEIIPETDKDDRLLMEIDENLVRAELSPAERAKHTFLRKEIMRNNTQRRNSM